MNIPNLVKTDIKQFRKKLIMRGVDATVIEHLYNLYKMADTKVQEKRAELNQASHEVQLVIGTKKPGNVSELRLKAAALKQELEVLESEFTATKNLLKEKLDQLPNVPDDTVPLGADEKDNVIEEYLGKMRDYSFTPKEHHVLIKNLGYDSDSVAAMAGARFTVMTGPIAKLHRAIGQLMIDTHTMDHGYIEANVPLLVNENAAYNTGQLPKFKDDIFETTDGRFLIPTAEVSLTNIVANQTLDSTMLPMRFTAITPCFRKEAGSAGKDTHGLIRQHQFDKCELVTICTPEQSEQEHIHMLKSAEKILYLLGLPYRRVLLCASDMGFAAQKTYDLEVWMPGQNAYREISSVSNCGEFQARRMNTRFKIQGEKGTAGFVHTLNGSGLAVGRTLAAVIETYQREDGTIEIPRILRPYMNNLAVIG